MNCVSILRTSLIPMIFVAAALSTVYTQAAADDLGERPREWCAKASDLLANQHVEEIPAMVASASRGQITPEGAQGFLGIKVITDQGKVTANSFLIEKNYNDAMIKIWHYVVFSESALYIRCTFYKRDGTWSLFDFSMNTDEVAIGLP